MNLTALYHREIRRQRLQRLLMLKDLRKRTNGRRFPRARLFWVRPGRYNEWWDNFITQRVTAEEWKENFHMNRETFLKSCGYKDANSLAAMLKVRENTPLYSVINWPQALFVPYASVQSVSPSERLVSILGRFCSYYAEVFFMSTRKAVRYSVDIA